jgi:prepilin-type N-terminal cleavage/methylation domain-containing protein
MPRRPSRRSRSGFTLIEMMFALAILAGGLLAMLMVQTQALKQGRYGRHTTEAMQVARDQMEVFLRLPWDAPAVQLVGWTVPTAVDLAVQNEGGAQTQQTFNVSWRISAAVPDVRVIEINVTWTEGDVGAGFPRSFRLASNKNNKPETS